MKELLSQTYSQDSFEKIVSNLIPDYEKNETRDESLQGFDSVKQLGISKSLDLAIFTIDTGKSVMARVDITKRAYAILKNHTYSHALIAFHAKDVNEWRLSLVTTKIQRTAKGSKETISNPRRYSYVLGPSAKVLTPLKQLSAQVGSIKELEKKFSLDVVNEGFYSDIATLYTKLVGGSRGSKQNSIEHERILKLGSNKDETYGNFAIRLIGRLVFCWFLKQKVSSDNTPLIGDIILSTNAVKENPDYYHSICAPLFFEVLNKDHDRRPSFSFGDEMFKNIPFLNGGLFSPHDEDEYEYESILGISRRGVVVIPDTWFQELFETFEMYNFTIDENTSIDTELSIDPEMLGRIFENLLAEINPETGDSARKSTGSFYTPREIVDYMVDESLINHLRTVTGIDEDKLRAVTSYNLDDDKDYPLTQTERESIIEVIFKTTTLDPACGSGAFPIGMLQKMVYVLEQADPDCQLYIDYELKDLSPEVRRATEQSFQNHNPTYLRKLGVIRRSIHGIDIQPIAADISRLRCFLTLIVDQKVDDNARNRGIDPLPNLDFKFVCANSLIKSPTEEGGLLKDSFAEKLAKLVNEFFAPVDQIHKLETSNKLQALINQKTKSELESIIRGSNHVEKRFKEALKEKNKKSDAERLRINALWESYGNIINNKPVGFFEPKYFFPTIYQNGGFDILIGNPPYVSTKGVDDETKSQLLENYGFADDLYSHFYYKGMELLKNKGVLAYITSKSFWTTQTKKNVRQLLLDNNLHTVYDTDNPFKSVLVDTCVVVVQKEPKNENVVKFLKSDGDYSNPTTLTVDKSIYKEGVNKVIFKPTKSNLVIYKKYNRQIRDLMEKWWGMISTSANITKHKSYLEQYRSNLKPGELTLLGLLSDGGVGLQTGSNGKFVGVVATSKEAKTMQKTRLVKFSDFVLKKKLVKYGSDKTSVANYFDKLSENEVRILFDELKVKHGRDIFGQGFLYRIVDESEIKTVSEMSDEEKKNGLSGEQTFVPYDKGDKDGNRWYLRTPYYIDWSVENVKFLKGNSGKKGVGMPVVRNPQFYFRAGFCWSDIHTLLIKTRLKDQSVHDVKSMSMFSFSEKCTDKFLVCLLNSTFLSEYDFTFVNGTSSFQINDARQLPIVIPTQEQLESFENLFDQAYAIKLEEFDDVIIQEVADQKLEAIQKELDEKVLDLYGLTLPNSL
ncbi:MAG: Eco57I restriction-modification methylase domain-containing protein [Candidatus Doudnabacteria bacterium]|nr:Eco57I restriction-modification methylase domain-containing protein [Candidatus Doudnabacteria bacterium]